MKKKSWLGTVLSYTRGQRGKFVLSVVLSVLSVTAGLLPYVCLYKVVELFVIGTAAAAAILRWCGLALVCYAVKVAFYTLSTGLSHHVAFHVLAALVTLPGGLVCMMLTFRISGKSFQKYNESNAYMNSTIVEYIEGIEVIKAFGRAGGPTRSTPTPSETTAPLSPSG